MKSFELFIFLFLVLFTSSSAAGKLAILQPAPPAVFYRDETVPLRAYWADSVSPPPEGVVYTWSSDVDGRLGEGLQSRASNLSYTSHLLTVTAQLGDSIIDSVKTPLTIIVKPKQFTLSERNDWEGEFSPQGDRVAYTSFRSGSPEIWVSTVAGRESTRITYQGGMAPSWSPDGLKLVFWSERAGGRDLWLVDLTQEPMTALPLTSDPSAEWMPAFHPLKNQVAFVCKTGKRLSIKVIDTDEPQPRAQELLGPELYPMFPRWFPDGKQLLFTSYADTLPAVCRYWLERKTVLQLSPPGAEDADVSPDGKLVVLVRNGEVWLHRLSDGFERPLTRDEQGALSPRFSPKGQQVIYASARSGNYDLWILNLPLDI